MKSIRRIYKFFAATTAAALFPLAAGAIELGDAVELHGYGHAGALATSDNSYLKADSKGTLDYYDIALLLTGTLSERAKVWAQVYAIYGEPRLDWAFFDYEFHDSLTLRVGQIKTPFGIYNEIRDIEYLRPSSLKPLMYHDGVDLIDEAFRGLSLSTTRNFSAGALAVNLYGGKIVMFEDDEHIHGPLFGIHAKWQPADSTLAIGISAYNTQITDHETGTKDHNNTGSLFAEFEHVGIRLKSEYVAAKSNEQEIAAFYLQSDVSLNDRLTPFARIEAITFDGWRSEDLASTQKVLSVGLGYRFTDTWSARIETHYNHGYALPIKTEALEAADAKPNWFLSAISFNFVF